MSGIMFMFFLCLMVEGMIRRTIHQTSPTQRFAIKVLFARMGRTTTILHGWMVRGNMRVLCDYPVSELWYKIFSDALAAREEGEA